MQVLCASYVNIHNYRLYLVSGIIRAQNMYECNVHVHDDLECGYVG